MALMRIHEGRWRESEGTQLPRASWPCWRWGEGGAARLCVEGKAWRKLVRRGSQMAAMAMFQKRTRRPPTVAGSKGGRRWRSQHLPGRPVCL